MEDTDGGLHPAVDGQSLDEDEDKDIVYITLRISGSSGSCPVQEAVPGLDKTSFSIS